MKKFTLLFLLISLVACTSGENTTDITDTTSSSTTVTTNVEENTTTTLENTEVVESYVYDKEKMSPFTGLELSPEIWLKRPRRVIAFKIDNNFNARPQSGLQEADSVMEILVEGGMTRFLAFYLDKTSAYVGPIRSARPTDPTLIRPYGGVLVVSGATAGLSLIHISEPTRPY